jgi:excisionase family DNA binding protein
MEYMNTKEAAKVWGVSDRRVRKLCSDGQVQGAKRVGRYWLIPNNTHKPTDQRIKNHRKYVFPLLNDLLFTEVQLEQLQRMNEKLAQLNSTTGGR